MRTLNRLLRPFGLALLPAPPTTPKMLREMANGAETHLRPRYPYARSLPEIDWLRRVAELTWDGPNA